MKKTLLLLVALLTVTITFASVEIDGIYYNLNNETKTAEVTYQYQYRDGDNYSGVTSITIPEKITYNATEYSVTSIGYAAFYECTSLTSITIPNNVTSIGEYAFYDCDALTSISIPNRVTSIGDVAFYGTPWLNNQPDGCLYIGKCLYQYRGEMPENTHIDVIEGTTMICGAAFSDCSSLTSITIPNSVTSIGSWAFEDCSSLTSITIPNSVTSIGFYAFRSTAWLNNQPDGCLYIGKCLYQYKGEMPENTHIDVNEGTTMICASAFYDCSSLTSITIPNSVTSIGDHAFYNCSSLTSITIEATTPPTLNDWLGYSGIIYIPDNTLSAYKEAWGTDYIFVNNETTLTIHIETPGTLSDKIFDAGQSPINVTKLTVTGTLNDDDFTCMRETMTSLVDVDLSGITNTTGINFNDKSNLIKILLPENLTYIGNSAFEYCSSLTSITIPNNVTSIGFYAFYWCKSLTSISIPNSVTSIGSYAFRSCSSLTSITIPNGVTSIGSSAFNYCSSLTSITCLGSTPPSANNLRAQYETCILFVPKGSLNDYQNHAEWGKFLNIQELKGENPTDLETSKISSANIYTTNGTLHIEGATENYHILDAAGRLIYSGNATTLTLPRGIYLITIGGEVEKIVL